MPLKAEENAETNSISLNLTLFNVSFIGLSCKTQELYLIVFCVRYLDLFMYFISMYNTFMKIFFISSTAFIIYLMRYKKPYCSVSGFPLLGIIDLTMSMICPNHPIPTYRLTILWAMTSPTLKYSSQQLSLPL